MKKFLIGTLLFLVGCQRALPTLEGPAVLMPNQLATPPRCGSGLEFFSAPKEIDGQKIFFEWCVMSQQEVNDLSRLVSPVADEPGLYAWRLAGLPAPILMLETEGGTLRGDFIYFAQLQPARPLMPRVDAEKVTLDLGSARFPIGTSTITYTLHNGSNEELNYGYHYALEFFDGEQWVQIPFMPRHGYFVDLGLALGPGQSSSYPLQLDLFKTEVFDLVPGLYRVRKDELDIVGEFELY